MKDEVRKHLHDIREAARAIRSFLYGKGFEEYKMDELLRSGVERKFEIIGEALSRLARDAPDILKRIRDHRDIISFRNILAHGYDNIDELIIWGIIEEDLDRLMEDVNQLLP